MVRPFHRSSPNQSPGFYSPPPPPAKTSGLFGRNFFAYRPLAMVAGLWLLLVGLSAFAYSRIMFTEVVMPPPRTSLEVLESPPLEALNPPPSGSGLTQASLTPALPPPENPLGTQAIPSQPAVVLESDLDSDSGSGGVMIWGLLSLVGLCACGCFLISQQVKAPPQSPKRKKARPQPPLQGHHRAKKPHPKPMAPYLPQRDAVLVPGGYGGATPVPPLPPEPPQVGSFLPGPPQPRLTRPGEPPRPAPPGAAKAKLPPAPPPAPEQHYIPTVVPAEEDHPLDWSEESIAHALDLRQRRSLSSLM